MDEEGGSVCLRVIEQSASNNDIPDSLGNFGASAAAASSTYGSWSNDGATGGQTANSVTETPIERHGSEYNMCHKNRGLALIFNHIKFKDPKIPERNGAEVDCAELSRTLKQLSFDVLVYKNPKHKAILKSVKWAAQQDHSDNDCILIAILSHGELGHIHAEDTLYKVDSVMKFFTDQNCPSLAGKPKLFFINACQGEGLDSGFTMGRAIKTELSRESSISFSYKLPVHPDFLIAYSTVPGFYSWRNPVRGSWFIQSLCNEFKANGKRYDILTLLTFVNKRVALNFESFTPDDPETNLKKQIPCITTMLTRILRFNNDKLAVAKGCTVV